MPGGSSPGSWPGRKGSRNLAVSLSSPNMICAIAPLPSGRASQAPGLALKALALANCRAGEGRSAAIASHVALVAKVIGMAGVAGAVSNTESIGALGLERFVG